MATTWTAAHILGTMIGKVLGALEKADGSFVAMQAGAANGLKIEGDPAGAPVPISGAVTTDVDTSALATQTTLAAVLAKIIAAPATEALQTAANALLGTIRNTTTPTKADAATGALEVDDRGNLHATLTVADDEIMVLQGPVATALTAAQLSSMVLDPLHCDGIECNTADVYVYGQLRESARLASILPAEWTAGDGWAFAGTVATHTAGGGIGVLELTTSVLNLGIPYALMFEVTMTAGELTDLLGTAGAIARTATGTYMQILSPTVDGKVHFSANDACDASIDIANVWVVPYHHLPSAGVEKARAFSRIVAVALKSAPATKVISPDTAVVKALRYRRQGAVQS